MSVKTSMNRLSLCIVEYIGVVGVVGVAVRALFGCRGGGRRAERVESVVSEKATSAWGMGDIMVMCKEGGGGQKKARSRASEGVQQSRLSSSAPLGAVRAHGSALPPALSSRHVIRSET